MKHAFRTFCCLVLALCGAACAHHTIIPDEKLALIFHDAFLANAYVGGRSLAKDSLNLYEPIFAHYGYTTEDVHYTIGNFSKRKSARLGDVVERAIALLEAEGKEYNREVAILDTIDRVALRAARRTLQADSLIRIWTLADTALLNFTFDVEPGEYSIQLKYLIDSLDLNARAPRGQIWLERADSSRVQNYTVTLRRFNEGSVSRKFTADTSHRRLQIRLLTYPEKPRRPSVTVRDLRIEYTPETRTAVERLYEQELGIRIFADEFFDGMQKDSL